MGFQDKYGNYMINEEGKVRIALGDRALITIADDMAVFGTKKTTTFINTVIANYRSEAKSSISLYLQQRRIELDSLFTNAKLDADSKEKAIKRIISAEEQEIKNEISEYRSKKGKSKLYHINEENVDYLLEECSEEQYYSRPGSYLSSILEEYCSLPFIERERIYRKDVYKTIEQACKEKTILKIKARVDNKDQLFYVYPYKIVPDPLHTQAYLVCYSRMVGETEADKRLASFSMARINPPTALSKTFFLNRQEISYIEEQLATRSPAYFISPTERIKVRLTEKGKQSYLTRLYSRPQKIESLSTDDIYVFDCTPQQIYNYFFPFGANAEIISPEDLRARFREANEKALAQYNTAADQ